MLLWSRPLIVAGIGVVSQGPEESQAAVPAGGGRAWPGFETTRRAKLAARTASGRAGPAVAEDLSGQQATSERGGSLPQAPTCKYQHV